jgi:uncharacterized membrane protein
MTSNMADDMDSMDETRQPPAGPGIKHITMDDPWNWLAAGWQDLRKAPFISLSYGAFFLIAGWVLMVLLLAVDMWFLVLPLAAGFMLIGPVVAVGLYEVSRALEHGEKPSLSAALTAWRQEASQLGMMCVVLVLLHLAWVLIAIVIFALFLGDTAPTLESLVGDVFFQPDSVPFLVFGTAAGAILALVVFSVSAVSIPLIVDRQTETITAILTSLRAVQQNWQAMMLWAGLIVIFTAAGIATLFVGLAVTLPLIGHATWHAYRAVVE